MERRNFFKVCAVAIPGIAAFNTLPVSKVHGGGLEDACGRFSAYLTHGKGSYVPVDIIADECAVQSRGSAVSLINQDTQAEVARLDSLSVLKNWTAGSTPGSHVYFPLTFSELRAQDIDDIPGGWADLSPVVGHLTGYSSSDGRKGTLQAVVMGRKPYLDNVDEISGSVVAEVCYCDENDVLENTVTIGITPRRDVYLPMGIPLLSVIGTHYGRPAEEPRRYAQDTTFRALSLGVDGVSGFLEIGPLVEDELSTKGPNAWCKVGAIGMGHGDWMSAVPGGEGKSTVTVRYERGPSQLEQSLEFMTPQEYDGGRHAEGNVSWTAKLPSSFPLYAGSHYDFVFTTWTEPQGS